MRTGREYTPGAPGAPGDHRNLFIWLLLFFIALIGIQAHAKNFYKAEPTKGIELDMNRISQRVKQVYTSQIGIRETPPNAGKQVEKYLQYVNLPKGNAWCAAFVCWVYGQAGVANPHSGWSPDLFKSNKVIWTGQSPGEKLKAKTSNLSVPGRNSQPFTGDIFGIYFPEKGRIAHTGFIDQWEDPWLITVEGNTNASGSREGDGVYRKRRLVRSIYRVARYIAQSDLNEP